MRQVLKRQFHGEIARRAVEGIAGERQRDRSPAIDENSLALTHHRSFVDAVVLGRFAGLAVDQALFDGEAVVLHRDGHSDFEANPDEGRRPRVCRRTRPQACQEQERDATIVPPLVCEPKPIGDSSLPRGGIG